MPPTPIHGPKAESEQAAWHRCANQDGGPVHEIKKELAAMGAKLEAAATATVELKTTFRTGAWWSAMSVSALAVAVAILAYLATTRTGGQTTKDESPSIVKTAHAADDIGLVPRGTPLTYPDFSQAHAETKGSTP